MVLNLGAHQNYLGKLKKKKKDAQGPHPRDSHIIGLGRSQASVFLNSFQGNSNVQLSLEPQSQGDRLLSSS